MNHDSSIAFDTDARQQHAKRDALRVSVPQAAVGEVMSQALRYVRVRQETRVQVHQAFMALFTATGLQQLTSYTDVEQVVNLISPAVMSVDPSRQGIVDVLRDSFWIRINRLHGPSRHQSGNVTNHTGLAYRASLEVRTREFTTIVDMVTRFPVGSLAYTTYAAAAKRAAKKCQLPFSIETLQRLYPSMTDVVARQIVATGNKEIVSTVQ